MGGRSLDDYRSGRSLMGHLGADRLIDPALTGMLLAIRRGLIDETNATSMTDFVLVDTVVGSGTAKVASIRAASASIPATWVLAES